jgi:hypothetical protein
VSEEKDIPLEHMLSNESLMESLPRHIQRFIKSMCNRHGGGRLAKEAKGLHLYLPCPLCLEVYGTRELDSKHLTINLDKYFNRGKFRYQDLNKADWSALCHKERSHMQRVSILAKYPNLEERGLDAGDRSLVVTVSSELALIDDGNGNLIPKHPGEVTPILDLPPNHPAVEYLLRRNYDLRKLTDQFRAGYCHAQWPEEEKTETSKGYKYRNMPDGWKDTPQGRIILYMDVRGVQKGWQARIIDKVEDGWKWYWHPYRNEWVAVEWKSPEGEWILREDYRDQFFKWKPSKYRTATGASRNMSVMGFDAALEWNKNRGNSDTVVMVCEGPLDAARLGPPAVAILGNSISSEQINLLRPFSRIVLVLDNDAAGQSGSIRAQHILHKMHREYEVFKLPDSVKDVGDMSPEDAQIVFQSIVDSKIS